MYDDDFLECYKRYKEIIDKCIPKEVLARLLGKANMGDSFEPKAYYDESGNELPF